MLFIFRYPIQRNTLRPYFNVSLRASTRNPMLSHESSQDEMPGQARQDTWNIHH